MSWFKQLLINCISRIKSLFNKQDIKPDNYNKDITVVSCKVRYINQKQNKNSKTK